MNDDTTKTTSRVHLDVEWNDWEGTLPVTNDGDELAEAIEAEIAELVEEGAYPEGLLFERHISGGLIDSNRAEATIEVSAPDSATLFEFYTAYCGGDKEQAADELREAEIEGFDLSVLPSDLD